MKHVRTYSIDFESGKNIRKYDDSMAEGNNLPGVYVHVFLAIMVAASVGIVLNSLFAAIGAWCFLAFISSEFATLRDKMEELKR